MVEPLLEIRGLNAWYGQAHALQGVDLDVGAGEIVALVGRNGAGKTTCVRAAMGLIAKRSGMVRFAGRDLGRRPAHERFALGLGYVPEDRRIFAGLTVRENLRLGPRMILLDEPSEGIMPSLVDEMAELFLALKRDGVGLLLIEQNVELALEISDRATVLDQGRVVFAGESRALLADPATRERYCSV